MIHRLDHAEWKLSSILNDKHNTFLCIWEPWISHAHPQMGEVSFRNFLGWTGLLSMRCWRWRAPYLSVGSILWPLKSVRAWCSWNDWMLLLTWIVVVSTCLPLASLLSISTCFHSCFTQLFPSFCPPFLHKFTGYISWTLELEFLSNSWDLMHCCNI